MEIARRLLLPPLAQQPGQEATGGVFGQPGAGLVICGKRQQAVVVKTDPWPAAGKALLQPVFDAAVLDHVEQVVQGIVVKLAGDDVTHAG